MITENEADSVDANLRDIMVAHAWVLDAVKQITACYEGARTGRDLRHMAILGESGTGKTRILNWFKDQHPTTRNDAGLQVPVLLVTVPSEPTVKAVAQVMLYALEDPLWAKGTHSEMTVRLINFIKRAGTRVLLLDELQHLVDRATTRVQHGVADWLKIVGDQSGANFCGAGLPRSRVIFSGDTQYRRRLRGVVELPLFDWNRSDHRAEFRSVLTTFQNKLAAYEFPNLGSEEMAFGMFLATAGSIGRVSNVLRQAIDDAKDAGRYVITLNDLNDAAKVASFDLPFDISDPFLHGSTSRENSGGKSASYAHIAASTPPNGPRPLHG